MNYKRPPCLNENKPQESKRSHRHTHQRKQDVVALTCAEVVNGDRMLRCNPPLQFNLEAADDEGGIKSARGGKKSLHCLCVLKTDSRDGCLPTSINRCRLSPIVPR